MDNVNIQGRVEVDDEQRKLSDAEVGRLLRERRITGWRAQVTPEWQSILDDMVALIITHRRPDLLDMSALTSNSSDPPSHAPSSGALARRQQPTQNTQGYCTVGKVEKMRRRSKGNYDL